MMRMDSSIYDIGYSRQFEFNSDNQYAKKFNLFLEEEKRHKHQKIMSCLKKNSFMLKLHH